MIFDSVWSDAVVSDGALSQAVRTLRRALHDEPREPRFIRTVSRHGHRFVCAEVVAEADEAVRAFDPAPQPTAYAEPEPRTVPLGRAAGAALGAALAGLVGGGVVPPALARGRGGAVE